jgi:hypothetical protein
MNIGKCNNNRGGRKMKKWIWISIFILLIFLLFCQKQTKEEPANPEKPQNVEKIAPIAQEIDKKASLAISNLAEGKVDEGASLLLDAVLLSRPSGSWPGHFENSILKAKEQFKEGNIQKGVVFISDALQLMKPSIDMPKEKTEEEFKDAEKMQKRDEPSQTAPIAKLIRDKISAAREEFKDGNADKGIILILEALQLFSPRSDYYYERNK